MAEELHMAGADRMTPDESFFKSPEGCEFVLDAHLPMCLPGASWDGTDNRTLVLEALDPESPFARHIDGKLQVGDRLLQVNGRKDNPEWAASCFEKGGYLEMIVQRPRVSSVLMTKTKEESWGIRGTYDTRSKTVCIAQLDYGVVKQSTGGALKQHDRLFKVNGSAKPEAMMNHFMRTKAGELHIDFWSYRRREYFSFNELPHVALADVQEEEHEAMDFNLDCDLPEGAAQLPGVVWDMMDKVNLSLADITPDSRFSQAVKGQLRAGDRIIECKNCRNNSKEILDAVITGGVVSLQVQRPRTVSIIFHKTNDRIWGLNAGVSENGKTAIINQVDLHNAKGVFSDYRDAENHYLIKEGDRLIEVNGLTVPGDMLKAIMNVRSGDVFAKMWIYNRKGLLRPSQIGKMRASYRPENKADAKSFFDFKLDCQLPPKCAGVTWDIADKRTCLLQNIEEGSEFAEKIGNKRMLPGDRVIKVNNVTENPEIMKNIINNGGHLQMIVQRPKTTIRVLEKERPDIPWGLINKPGSGATSVIIDGFAPNSAMKDEADMQATGLKNLDRIFEVNGKTRPNEIMQMFDDKKVLKVECRFWVYPPLEGINEKKLHRIVVSQEAGDEKAVVLPPRQSVRTSQEGTARPGRLSQEGRASLMGALNTVEEEPPTMVDLFLKGKKMEVRAETSINVADEMDQGLHYIHDPPLIMPYEAEDVDNEVDTNLMYVANYWKGHANPEQAQMPENKRFADRNKQFHLDWVSAPPGAKLRGFIIMSMKPIGVRLKASHFAERSGEVLYPGECFVGDAIVQSAGQYAVRLPNRRGYVMVMGSEDGEEKVREMTRISLGPWWYKVYSREFVVVRAIPSYDVGARTHHVLAPEELAVVDITCRIENHTFCRLADGRGWVFQKRHESLPQLMDMDGGGHGDAVFMECEHEVGSSVDFASLVPPTNICVELGQWTYAVGTRPVLAVGARKAGAYLAPMQTLEIDKRACANGSGPTTGYRGRWWLHIKGGNGWVPQEDTHGKMLLKEVNTKGFQQPEILKVDPDIDTPAEEWMVGVC